MSKKNSIRIIPMLLMILISIGCTTVDERKIITINSSTTDEEKLEFVLQNMSDRYSDSFTVIEHSPSVWTNRGDVFLLKAERFPDKEVWFEIRNEQENFELFDNYYFLLKEQEYIDYLKAFADENFTEYIVYTGIDFGEFDRVSQAVTSDLSLENLYEVSKDQLPYLIINIPKGTKNTDELMEGLLNVAKGFQEKKIQVMIDLKVINPDFYETLKMDNKIEVPYEEVLKEFRVSLNNLLIETEILK